MDNSEMVFFICISVKICCDPSLDPSCLDIANEGSQHKQMYEKLSLDYP